MNVLEGIELKRSERIRELLEHPPEQRTEKMLLELMSFTREFKLFECIAMSESHQDICRSLSLVYCKPYDIIYNQGDIGDSFFYILNGVVKQTIQKKLDPQLFPNSPNKKLTRSPLKKPNLSPSKYSNTDEAVVEKYIGDLRTGQSFGELSLIYGTNRTTTMISATNTILLKLEKKYFDKFIKEIFEEQINDLIEFLKICPIFTKVPKEQLIKMAIRTEVKKLYSDKEVLCKRYKSDNLFIIRRGSVRILKTIEFIKDESSIRKKLTLSKSKIAHDNFYQENLKILNEINQEKILEILSKGPTEDDINNKNVINKELVLETLKMGDVFPSYYALNHFTLDIDFITDSPSELISFKISDLEELIPESYKMVQEYAKPYPSEEFLRKFYYFNSMWLNFKTSLRRNIAADVTNKLIVDKKKLREKFKTTKNMNDINLPKIFSSKSYI